MTNAILKVFVHATATATIASAFVGQNQSNAFLKRNAALKAVVKNAIPEKKFCHPNAISFYGKTIKRGREDSANGLGKKYCHPEALGLKEAPKKSVKKFCHPKPLLLIDNAEEEKETIFMTATPVVSNAVTGTRNLPVEEVKKESGIYYAENSNNNSWN